MLKYKMEMNAMGAKDENLCNTVTFVEQLSMDTDKVKSDHAVNGDAPYSSSPQRIYLWAQLLSAVAVSMGTLIVGFSFGYTSPALLSMSAEGSSITISAEQASWIGGLMPLAALVGAIAGGPLIDCFGRRRTIMLNAIPFFLGWMLIAYAPNVTVIFYGRVFCGVCVGIGSLAFTVYLGETIQPEVRGAIGLLPTVFGNVGILSAFAVGSYLNWYHLAIFGAALSIPSFSLMLLIPETPRWYVTKGQLDDARKALQWLRGKNVNVDHEFQNLTRSQAETDKQSGSVFKTLFSRNYAPTVLVALGLMLFQQLSGINAVIFYAADIFKKSGGDIDANTSSVIIGVVNFVSAFIATAIIDRLGRKMLLYISSISMIVTLVIFGGYYYVKETQGMDVKNIGWIPLASLVIYVFGFSIGFGPIPWLMLGEILPSRIRGTAASLCSTFNWTCAFIVTKTFKNIINAINMYGTVWTFSVICIIGLFFVIFFVPETRGKSLEEIEEMLTARGPRKRRVANSNKRIQNLC